MVTAVQLGDEKNTCGDVSSGSKLGPDAVSVCRWYCRAGKEGSEIAFVYLKDFLLYTLGPSTAGSKWQSCSVTYCSDDSIQSSLPGIGENVGALGGS